MCLIEINSIASKLCNMIAFVNVCLVDIWSKTYTSHVCDL